jgi:hypothetical protein
MKKLLQFDKLDGERKGIIRKIAEEEQIVTQLYESFSAYQIPKAEIFPSLLFYYGMLTIKGTRGSKLILGIPNNNVRKQYYGYLEEEYQAKAYVDVNQLTDYYYDMAYDGKWEEGLRFMADAYAKVSSVRDGIEAERNLQGFFMAYLNLNDYYITAPELELNHGYCDFFLLPDLTHYASQHSYILELKVLSKKDFSAIVEAMLTGIMGKVWQKEEITKAMIQLQLWSRDIIIIQIQISHEESLQVSLSLNAITHR